MPDDRVPPPPIGTAYDFRVEIDPADIDFMGHVNNASYLKWVQAAVTSHWQHFASAEDVRRHLWVALRHEISYRRPAFLGDPIVATVVLDKLGGARAWYDTAIRRGAELLAEARSVWCCIDAATQRPVRIRQSMIERFV